MTKQVRIENADAGDDISVRVTMHDARTHEVVKVMELRYATSQVEFTIYDGVYLVVDELLLDDDVLKDDPVTDLRKCKEDYEFTTSPGVPPLDAE